MSTLPPDKPASSRRSRRYDRRHRLGLLSQDLARSALGPGQKSALVKLLLCAAASTALYVTAVGVYPLLRYAPNRRLYDIVSLSDSGAPGALFYAIVIVSLFWLYSWAWRCLLQLSKSPEAHHISLLIVAVVAVICALILVWLYPINATDLFQYFFRSRILVLYGGNPLVDPPLRYYTDPYIYTVGEWRSIVSPYGPLWELLASAAARLAGGALLPNLMTLKAIFALSYGGSLFLVYAILGRLAPSQQISGTLLFAWNPLILLEWIGNGHNDAVMSLFILLGIWLWTRKQHLWVLPALVLAALVKSIAAVVIPLFLLDLWLGKPDLWARVRWLVPTLLLSSAAFVLLFAPFGPLLRGVRGMVNEATGRHGFSFMMTIALFLHYQVFVPLYSAGFLSYEATKTLVVSAYTVPRWLALCGIAGLYVRQLLLVWRRKRGPVAAGAEAFFIVLVLIPSYRMWYPAWSMTLTALALTRERLLRTGTASLAAELSVLVYSFLQNWSHLARHLLGVTLTLVLPLLLPTIDRWVHHQHPRGACFGHPSRASRQTG